MCKFACTCGAVQEIETWFEWFEWPSETWKPYEDGPPVLVDYDTDSGTPIETWYRVGPARLNPGQDGTEYAYSHDPPRKMRIATCCDIARTVLAILGGEAIAPESLRHCYDAPSPPVRPSDWGE